MRRVLAFVLLVCALVAAARSARANEAVQVLVPDRENLQYMSFWIAKGAGYFADEGIDIDLVAPPGPQQTQAYFEDRKADVAVLPPPVYLNLVAAEVPVVLVANLLANDPIALVVRRNVLAERHLDRNQPLHARLEGLRGIRLGVAPHPPTRLRILFSSEGLDADKDVSMVIFHGKEQNAAFHEGKVDALYAHTPFLERAILHDDAQILVDQCSGEVKPLANRPIHMLSVRRSLLETRPALVTAMVRAIARAQDLLHRSEPDAVAALVRELPTRDRREIETIVHLYAPAVPETPAVQVEALPGSVIMFPAGAPAPDLSRVDFRKHVADLLPHRGPRSELLGVGIGLGLVMMVVLWGLRKSESA